MKPHYSTEAGVERFERYLTALRSDPLLTAPREILDDPEFATPIEGTTELTEMVFPSRMDAAKFLHALLAPISEPERNKGLWAWLSLFFFDSVCPADGNGNRKPGELPRHVPEVGNYQRYYRHLLLGPYLIHRFFSKNPDAALSLLWQPVHKPGDIVGQLAARQELVTNFGAIEAATRLYYDPMEDYLYVPNSPRLAGYNIRRGLAQPLDELSKVEFLTVWHSVSYLFPGLHPDGFEDPDSGWPRALKRFAAEAWARAEAGEMRDAELYPSEAAWSGIFDRMQRAPFPEETERRITSACRYGAPALG